VDLETGAVTTIAEGLGTPSAVNLDSQGRIYAVGWDTGELMRIDAKTGEREIITTVDPPVDNLAIDADDNIYLSIPARGAIIKVDPKTGAETEIVPGSMGVPGGLAITMVDGRETLVIADDYAFRHADTETGRLWATVDLAEFMDTSTASDIAASDNDYIISDLRRSLVYSVNRKTGEKTYKWKRIARPYGVAILDSGEVLVAEHQNGQILRLNRDDTRARDVFADNLDGPVGMVRTGDAIFVTEATGGNVIKFDIKSGAKSIVATTLDQPEGITRMINGNLAVVEVGKQRVVEINPATGELTVLAYDLPVGRKSPQENDPVYVPSGIAAGADGSLYLSSDQQLSILKLTPSS
jgi:sugar lactone lactonase YvrE